MITKFRSSRGSVFWIWDCSRKWSYSLLTVVERFTASIYGTKAHNITVWYLLLYTLFPRIWKWSDRLISSNLIHSCFLYTLFRLNYCYEFGYDTNFIARDICFIYGQKLNLFQIRPTCMVSRTISYYWIMTVSTFCPVQESCYTNQSSSSICSHQAIHSSCNQTPF